jgi:hypothetical protein
MRPNGLFERRLGRWFRLGETSRPFRRPSPTSCRKGLESAMVEGQVVLVDPLGKKVLAVITQEP